VKLDFICKTSVASTSNRNLIASQSSNNKNTNIKQTLELMMNERNLYLINKHAPQCFKSAHSFVLRLSAIRRMRSALHPSPIDRLRNFNWICIRVRPETG